MEVVVHYPKDEHAIEELGTCIAKLHIDYISSNLIDLDISQDEKREISNYIRQAYE